MAVFVDSIDAIWRPVAFFMLDRAITCFLVHFSSSSEWKRKNLMDYGTKVMDSLFLMHANSFLNSQINRGLKD
jgi:hypothetical protein